MIPNLAYDRVAAIAVREFVHRGQACCGCLGFDVEETAETVSLTIPAVPEARRAGNDLFACFVA